MKKIWMITVMILGIGLLMFLYVGVVAGSPLFQEDTPTDTPTATWTGTETEAPTGTFYPVFKTPTLGATSQFDCALSYPTNWMTLTPYQVWVQQCIHCLYTLTPYSSWTPWSTFTPLATVSGQATPTKTNTPTTASTSSWGYPFLFRISAASTGGLAIQDDLYCESENGVQHINDGATVDIVSHWVHCWGRYKSDWVSGSNKRSYINFIARANVNGHFDHVFYNIVASHITSGSYVLAAWDTGVGDTVVQFVSPIINKTLDTYQSSASSIIKIIDVCFSEGGYGDNCERTVATPTANWAGSYCNSVDGYLPGAAPSWTDYFPIPTIGEEICLYIPISPVKAVVELWKTILSADWNLRNFPVGINYCTDYMYFGSVDLFGVTISFDTLFVGLAGIAAIFIFLRS